MLNGFSVHLFLLELFLFVVCRIWDFHPTNSMSSLSIVNLMINDDCYCYLFVN